MNKSLIIFNVALLLLCACKKNKSYTITQLNSSTNFDLYNSISVNDSLTYIFGGNDYSENSFITLNKNNFIIQNKPIPLVFNKAFKNGVITCNGKIFIGGVSGVLVYKQLLDTNWQSYQTASYETVTGLAANNKLLISSINNNGATIELRDTNLKILNTKAVTHDLQDLAWLTDAKAIACGTGAVMLSADSGHSWQYTNAKGDVFNSLAIVNAQTIYLSGLGGSIRKSIDGGNTWKKIIGLNTNRTIQKIIFSKATNQLLIVGYNGLCCILNTANDEISTIKKFTNGNLLGAEIIDENTFIAFGEKGEVWQAKK